MNEAGTYEGSLLLTLEEISQLVAHSHDPRETLSNIVRLIQGRFHTAVCSVYLLEPGTGELVLAATVGLEPGAVGRVRMRPNEGLTGLTAEGMAPVMVPDAFGHPRFKYFPESGEDPFHSFLGVPLVEGGALQGVLVVQTVEPRTFEPSEVRTLVTVAAQLAPLVGDALLLEQIAAAVHVTEPAPCEPAEAGEPQHAAASSIPPAPALKGMGLSPGRGVGQAYVVDGFEEWRQAAPRHGAGPDAERRRLAEAMARARDELVRLSQHISELVGEDHGAILQAQLMLMQDRTIEQDLDACLASGVSAEAALIATLDKYVAAFQKVTTPFIQERVYDLKDVFHRLLWQLRPRPGRAGSVSDRSGGNGDRIVLVAREASVMELFAVDVEDLAGVVVEHGSPQSHAAILARSLDIPMVGQVADFTALSRPGRRLLVDGDAGTVTLDPPQECGVRKEPGVERSGTPSIGVEGSGTPGGRAALAPGLPRVEVNLNLLYEVRAALALGIEGVGLYRSEFLFLARRALPTEEEQVGTYRKLLQLLAGRPVTIRTFDLRPDKLAAYSHLGPAASRPFDWRRVLESQPLQQLFRDQVRAILRAAVVGPVRILVPLVTSSELLDFVARTVEEAHATLKKEGLEQAVEVPLGVMIEVAASVAMVPAWAEQAAFFALGTNDLTASALGLDRDDPLSSGQADALHPGLLRLIDRVVADAHAAGRPVSVCGEVAADPLGAVALAALGVDSLSVPVNQFAATRQALAEVKPAALAEWKRQLLGQRTTQEVRSLLRQWTTRGQPGGIAGK
jgi:phosphotransferase system enzyme I (PtsP)